MQKKVRMEGGRKQQQNRSKQVRRSVLFEKEWLALRLVISQILPFVFPFLSFRIILPPFSYQVVHFTDEGVVFDLHLECKSVINLTVRDAGAILRQRTLVSIRELKKREGKVKKKINIKIKKKEI